MQETVEDPLDIETVAERCGISARDLQYLFQAAPENKPQKMYMALRLQHAKELWLYNAMSIRETGLASGLARRPPITGLSTQFIKQANRNIAEVDRIRPECILTVVERIPSFELVEYAACA